MYDLLEYIQELIAKAKNSDAEEGEEILDEVVMLINHEFQSKHKMEIIQDNLKPDEFFKILRKNHSNLTFGQEQMCYYDYLGLSRKEISILLNVSIRTVENRIYFISKSIKPIDNKTLRSYLLDLVSIDDASIINKSS
jgi:DNA-directed RNA polymerase specialized sigma24 family protein